MRNVKSKFIIACTLFLVVAVMSCVEKDMETAAVYNGKKAIVPITLKSENGIGGASEIATVRCILFTTDDRLVSNKLYTISPGTNPCIITAEVARGRNDFYIICNETEEMKKTLERITSPTQIDGVRFDVPTNGITASPMFSEILDTEVTCNTDGTNVRITAGGNTSSSLGVNVTRIVSKLGMTVVKNVPSGTSDFSIEEISYTLCRIPKYSGLKEGILYPDDAGWAENMEVTGTGKIRIGSNGTYQVDGDTYTVPAGLDAVSFPDIYMPEHLLEKPEDAGHCTYMLIDAKCVTSYNSSVIHAKYLLNLGQRPPADHSIKRNVYYRIYAVISGLGAAGFYAEIVPVDEYDLPLTWKPFEGYAIVGERVEDYGSDLNIWNSYSQYSGILKIVKDSKYSNALFRYGSIVALAAGTSAGEFAAADVLWMPDVTKTAHPVNAWDDLAYFTSEDISGTNHTLENIKAGKGDPCRLVGLSESEIAAGTIDNHLWRMPTSAEMKWLETARNGTTDSRGFYSFSYLLTPFNGYRSVTGTMISSDATAGRYWSATGANSFVFGSTNNATIAADDPRKAYSVRCIRTDIPESVFDVNGTIINYSGGSSQISPATHTVIVPYWRMELADPADASRLSLSKSEGSVKEYNTVTMQPAVNPYEKREFYVKATGYGLDGKVHEKIATVTLKTLGHTVKLNWTSEPTLDFVDGYYHIPVTGAVIRFTMSITPEPYKNIYPGFDNLEWRIENKYYTSKLNTEYGTSAVRNGVSEIVVKPNTWGHLLGLEIRMVPSQLEYPPHTSENITFIQDK